MAVNDLHCFLSSLLTGIYSPDLSRSNSKVFMSHLLDLPLRIPKQSIDVTSSTRTPGIDRQ